MRVASSCLSRVVLNACVLRHLLRLWLSMPNDRDLPECFKQRYGSIEIGNRGGIVTQKTKLQVPFI